MSWTSSARRKVEQEPLDQRYSTMASGLPTNALLVPKYWAPKVSDLLFAKTYAILCTAEKVTSLSLFAPRRVVWRGGRVQAPHVHARTFNTMGRTDDYRIRSSWLISGRLVCRMGIASPGARFMHFQEWHAVAEPGGRGRSAEDSHASDVTAQF